MVSAPRRCTGANGWIRYNRAYEIALMRSFNFYVVVLVACDHGAIVSTDARVDTPPTISYARDIQPIWNARCTSCHSWTQGPNAVNQQRPRLDATFSFDALHEGAAVGCFRTDTGQFEPLSYVVPNDPETSALVAILSANPPRAQCQSARGMPRDTGPLETLAPAEYALVRRWVVEGARNN